MRLLARDGWSSGELRMTFHICRPATISRHVTGDCAHDGPVAPDPDWSGNQAPGSGHADEQQPVDVRRTPVDYAVGGTD